MTYIVDGEVFHDVDDVLDYCIDADYHWDDDDFESWVNDNYDSVYINGVTYYPYDILREADDGNLDDLRNDYCESCNENDRDNYEWELERASDGDTIYVQAYTVRVKDDENYDDNTNAEEALQLIRERLDSEKEEQKKAEEEKRKEELELMQIIGG